MTRKFQLNQRVSTPFGDGVIDTMPYNEDSDVYGVWLDKPRVIETSCGAITNQWEPIFERCITAMN